jgi:hypothetical protein
MEERRGGSPIPEITEEQRLFSSMVDHAFKGASEFLIAESAFFIIYLAEHPSWLIYASLGGFLAPLQQLFLAGKDLVKLDQEVTKVEVGN